MTIGQVKLYLLFGFAVLLFLFIIGIGSDVSLGASFYRAVVGGTLFSLITFAIYNILRLTVFYKPAEPIEENLTSKFDFQVADDGVSGTMAPMDHREEKVSGDEKPGGVREFRPIQAQQIDPDLNKVINEDPERAAELVRRMGLDEE